MTCIVGYIDKAKKEVVMGADSICSDGFTRYVMGEPKVFTKGRFIIGYTSSFRMGQLIQYKLKPPVHSKELSTLEYMSTKFVDVLKKLLKDNGYAQVKDNNEQGGTFLIGYNGELFTIQDDYAVLNFDVPYVSCGSGCYHAEGALFALEYEDVKINIKDKVRTAIFAADCNVTTVSSPILVLTGGKKFRC